MIFRTTALALLACALLLAGAPVSPVDAQAPPPARLEQKVSAEKGGGTWARMFVPGSMADVALTPQHWGMYAT